MIWVGEQKEKKQEKLLNMWINNWVDFCNFSQDGEDGGAGRRDRSGRK